MPHDLSSIKKFLSFRHIAISIILAVSVAVYLNTLSNDFVYDDTVQVLQNPWIKDVKFIPAIFTSDVWAFRGEGPSNYYRPLLHIIFMIDYYIFGLNPLGFHLVNIVFHAVVSVLVFLIASMLINHPTRREKRLSSPLTGEERGEGKYNFLFPLIAAILFATHPIHTEVVAWVSGIPELSFTLFYLLSFYFYIKADGEYGRHFLLSILFFFLSTLCKETALTLPILLIAYDYSFKNISHPLRENHNNSSLPLRERIKVRVIIKRYLPYLIVSGIYFIIRTYAIGGFAPLKIHTELSNYEYFINIFPLFIQYLEKLILPINLNAFYVLHPISSILEWKGIISIIITINFILAIYFTHKANKLAFFSLLWIVIPLLPVLYIPALGEATFADRYLYLPSVGFVIIVAVGVERICQLKVLREATVFAIILILIAIICLYSTGIIKRNYIWKSDYTLWLDTVWKSPGGGSPHYNLGNAYYNQGQFNKAIQEYLTALRLNPDHAKAHHNLGVAYYNQGQFNEAIQEYLIALRLNPYDTVAHNNLGNVYYSQGHLNKAIQEYITALKLNPDYVEAHYNLGVAYMEKGLEHMAKEEFEIVLKLRPDLLLARQFLESFGSKSQTFTSR